MKDNIRKIQKEEIKNIKKRIAKVLDRLDLASAVSIQEIEQELRDVETAFGSLLLLGILSRILYREDNEAAGLFVPAVTEWKNHLPCKDLDGMSPFEFKEKHPPGPYEMEFINTLINGYQQRLEALRPDTKAGKEVEKDIEKDFDKFQKEFFNRIPLEQPFIENEGNFMTIREIIKEERRRNGTPPDKINEIGVKVFAENTAEGTGGKMAQLEDIYQEAISELDMMQKNKKKRVRKRVKEIRKILEDQELYQKCGPAAHQFYFNYAMVVFLDEEDPKKAIKLIDKALSYKPDYDMAIEVKENIKAHFK